MKNVFKISIRLVFITVLWPRTFAQQMPACASQCWESSLKAQDTCAPTNVTCICATPPLMGAIQGCVLSTCRVIEALSAQNATQTMCGQPVRDITHITPIVTGLSGGAALFSVIVRICRAGRNIALDDVFAIVAIVSALPMGILEFFMAADGFGKDIWTIPAKKIYRIVQFTWLTEVFYFMALAFTKLSLLFFLLRIFPDQRFRQMVYILIGVSAAYGIAFTITCLFNCTPISYIWENWDGEHSGKCLDLHVFAWAHAGINIVLDVIILAIPIPQLLRLSLSTKKKMYIIIMFSIGAFTTIVSVVRLQALVQFSASANPTYDNVPTAYWSVLEAFVSIFCICMPALRRFLAGLFPRCFGSTQTDSAYEHYDTPDTPNRVANNKPKIQKTNAGFGLSTFGSTGITKTLETRVESKCGEEDEIELVRQGVTGNPKEEWSSRRSEGDAESG